MSQIEHVLVSMYQGLEDVKQKIMDDLHIDTVKGSQVLEEFSFSQCYADFQRVLIDCIEDYGESIMTLFGIDSLIVFL